MSLRMRRLGYGAALLAALGTFAAPAAAQTKLKWAHVYEVAEPYHTEALWAAEEIKKRTNGRYEISVFPASQLGNENQINEGLGLGTVDMIYTGVAFAASIHKPIGVTNAPYALRDFDHFMAYRASPLFRQIAKGYEDKTKHKVITLTYYGQRHVTANKAINKPEDMKGMKLRVPPAPLFLMFTKSVGANATPIAFAEVYLALQQGTVDGQENPLPTIQSGKLFEVQKYLVLTGHIITPRLVIINDAAWGKIAEADRAVIKTAIDAATAWQDQEILKQEATLADSFKRGGMVVIEPDVESFRKPVLDSVPAKFEGKWGKGLWERISAT
jgi:tripartite ATP-independent transporter DctP family solute receptor